ncbi:hypothetical protein [Qipengyuania sp. DGS5-3]|uniref:hypothetical protein n=1 Tax=Qipengyuania sp. DGS5-3 TaxID=3349632 RepID=UPI0036D2476D
MNGAGSTPAPAQRGPEPSRAPNNAARTHEEPPRQQAENRTLRDRFSEKLAREDGEKSGSAKGATIAEKEGQARSAILEQQGERSDQGMLSGGDDARLQLAAATAAREAGRSSATMDTQMLSRMAAQIAEGWPCAKASSASIQFPEGSLAETAQIKREADGSIAIRIAGLDPRLTAQQTGRAHLELLNAFARRRLSVNSLHLERTKPERDELIQRRLS